MRSQPLFRGTSLSITEVSCRGANTREGAEEWSTSHQLLITRSGVFIKHSGRDRVIAAPAQLLFFNAQDPYRVSHPAPGGDECTVLAFAPEVLTEAIAPYDAATLPERPFRISHAPLPGRVLGALRRLRAGLGRGELSVLETEAAGLGLLAAMLRAAFGGRASAQRLGAAALRSRRALADAVQLRLARDPGSDATLSRLAHDLGCSCFHLARSFSAHVGMPIHQYLLRVRLARALDRLEQGESNLSRLAFELGFSSHGHFSMAFRAAFGCPPSGFRCTQGRAARARAGKIWEVV